MAIFLSRIKKALNLGTKSITQNGTYNASTDGYDGYSSVEVNVPQITPTSITPSNSTPAALTANTPVTPTRNGYAIQSYDDVTPSSTPTSVSSGDIVKIGGSGVIVDSVPTPTNLFPSNTNPATITNGNLYRATSDGKAVTSVADLTPSNTTPVYLYGNSVYKAVTNGYAISSYSSKTPSDSSPASVSSGDIIKASASGYLYSTVQPKMKIGTISAPTSATTYTVNCGFQPKKIFVYTYVSSTKYMTDTYDVDVDSTYQFMGYKTSSSSSSEAVKRYALTATNNGIISGITSTGFTWRGWSTLPSLYYVAIG